MRCTIRRGEEGLYLCITTFRIVSEMGEYFVGAMRTDDKSPRQPRSCPLQSIRWGTWQDPIHKLDFGEGSMCKIFTQTSAVIYLM